MTEVVLLISSLLLADLQSVDPESTSATKLLRESERQAAVFKYNSAFPDPEREGAYYLSVAVGRDADVFAKEASGLEGVFASYSKPAADLP
ncbi:MAG: hypothetical protein AAF619_03425 [Pseudomonadota bacterium]